MKHIFIDTNFFEENNFFKGKLDRLYKYVKDGYIELYTNDLVIREVKSRISKKMAFVKANCTKLFNKSDFHILGNTSHSEIIRQLKKTDYYSEEIKRLCSDFDKIIIETPFRIIPYQDIDFGKIIEDYFSENPPFKEGDKKCEFPDAFIISSIERYCEKNKVNMIAISNDEDWLQYKSTNFNISNKIDLIFEDIVKEIKHRENIFITNLINVNENMILDQIEKYITENINFENTDYFDSEITNFTIRKLELIDKKITSIEDNLSEISLSIHLNLTAEITYPDYENAIWDNEDKVYFLLKEVTANYDFEEFIDDVILSIEYNLEDESNFELEIESINNDNPIELTINQNN